MEWRYVLQHFGTYINDCYVMLLPVCIFLFACIKNININLKHSQELRYFLKISFPLHYSFAKVYSILLNNQSSLLVYLFAIISCIIVSCIIKRIENKVHILKFSH